MDLKLKTLVAALVFAGSISTASAGGVITGVNDERRSRRYL